MIRKGKFEAPHRLSRPAILALCALWFSVDDGDLATKRALTAVMFFFTLTEGGGGEKLPLVTIPAQ